MDERAWKRERERATELEKLLQFCFIDRFDRGLA
jgi:hypothetical protein